MSFPRDDWDRELEDSRCHRCNGSRRCDLRLRKYHSRKLCIDVHRQRVPLSYMIDPCRLSAESRSCTQVFGPLENPGTSCYRSSILFSGFYLEAFGDPHYKRNTELLPCVHSIIVRSTVRRHGRAGWNRTTVHRLMRALQYRCATARGGEEGI